MGKKKGLGRGLQALIPQNVSSQVEDGPVYLRVDDIEPNPYQPRQNFNAQKLEELAESIKEHGLIQPLVVTQQGEGKYYIIAGERRWRASKIAGLVQVVAFIKETIPQQMLELALVENVQRADLNPLEEASAYAHLMDEFGLTQEVVAQRVGKSRTAVANTLRLLKLPQELKEALAAEKITEGHARALLSLPKRQTQQDALNTVVSRNMTVRQTEALVRQLISGHTIAKKNKTPLTAHDKDMVRRFENKLSTKVDMSRNISDHGGRITIHFYSDEELQSLFEAILGDEETL